MNTAHKKHLLFLSYYFPPMGGGGVQRILKFLKYWDYERYEISVLTVKHSLFYAEDKELMNDLPSSVKVYRTGSLDPFRLIYIIKKILTLKGSGKEEVLKESSGIFRKISNYVFIPDSRLFWLPFAVNKIWKIHKAKPIDLLIASVPPFTTAMIALSSKKYLDFPVLIDFRDAWTKSPYLLPLTKMHQYLQSRMESKVIHSADILVFVNPHMQKYYMQKYENLSQNSTHVVRNGFDREDFVYKKESEKIINLDAFKIGIMGTVYSRGNSPLPLVKVMHDILEKKPKLRNKIKIYLIGKWTGNFIEKVNSYDLEQEIEWVKYLPHSQALSFCNQMDVMALAVEEHLEGSENVTPGRIYEYLNLKKPILAMCPIKSDLAYLINYCEAGEVVSYNDLESLKMVLEVWINNKNNLQQKYSFKNLAEFERKDLTQKMIRLIDNFLL